MTPDDDNLDLDDLDGLVAAELDEIADPPPPPDLTDEQLVQAEIRAAEIVADIHRMGNVEFLVEQSPPEMSTTAVRDLHDMSEYRTALERWTPTMFPEDVEHHDAMIGVDDDGPTIDLTNDEMFGWDAWGRPYGWPQSGTWVNGRWEYESIPPGPRTVAHAAGWLARQMYEHERVYRHHPYSDGGPSPWAMPDRWIGETVLSDATLSMIHDRLIRPPKYDPETASVYSNASDVACFLGDTVKGHRALLLKDTARLHFTAIRWGVLEQVTWYVAQLRHERSDEFVLARACVVRGRSGINPPDLAFDYVIRAEGSLDSIAAWLPPAAAEAMKQGNPQWHTEEDRHR